MNLELKVPPLAVVAVAALLMWAIAWALPFLDLALPGRRAAAILAALLGWGIVLSNPAGLRRYAAARHRSNIVAN